MYVCVCFFFVAGCYVNGMQGNPLTLLLLFYKTNGKTLSLYTIIYDYIMLNKNYHGITHSSDSNVFSK